MVSIRPTVLIVDDEERVADTYALRLDTEYETQTAYGGEAALEAIDSDVDAVLLDRRMPDIHGDDVLDEVRDRGYDGAVIMTTAVDPDLNILEMDFDDYLCKPIDQDTLVETIDQHIESGSDREERLNEFLRITSKISVLKEQKTRAELDTSDEYRHLQERAESLARELRDHVEDFDELIETHRAINRA